MDKHLEVAHAFVARVDAKKRGRSEPDHQLTIADSVKRGYDNVLAFRNKGRMLIARAMISTNQSSCVLDDEAVRAAFKFLVPSFHLPHRTLGNKLIDTMYDRMNATLKQLVLEADFVSVTSDAAVMNFSGEPYIVVTAHFFHQWRLIDAVLALKSAPGSHTSLNISDLLDECLKFWKLRELPAIVNDNGANFVAASNAITRGQIEGLHIDEQFRCAAHTLQLVIDDALYFKPLRGAKGADRNPPAGHVQLLVDKVANAVNFLRNVSAPVRMLALRSAQQLYRNKLRDKHNSARQAELNAANSASRCEISDSEFDLIDDGQQAVDHASGSTSDSASINQESSDQTDAYEYNLTGLEHRAIVSRAEKLILRNATRWSSTFSMLSRFLLWASPINETLAAFHADTFSETELSTIDELVRILAPFKMSTDILQASSTITISLIWPTMAVLYHRVSTIRAQTEIGRTVVRLVSQSLVDRFHLHGNLSSHSQLMACICDIRFKSLRFLEPAQATAAWEIFKQLYLKELASVQADSPADVAQPVYDSSSDELTPYSYAGGARITQPQPETEEFRRYEIEPARGREQDPISWWSENELRFPIISRIAKRILAIPASSAPSERLFSIAGAINTKQRAHMGIDKLPKLTCLKHNLRTLDKLGIDLTDAVAAIDDDRDDDLSRIHASSEGDEKREEKTAMTDAREVFAIEID